MNSGASGPEGKQGRAAAHGGLDGGGKRVSQGRRARLRVVGRASLPQSGSGSCDHQATWSLITTPQPPLAAASASGHSLQHEHQRGSGGQVPPQACLLLDWPGGRRGVWRWAQAPGAPLRSGPLRSEAHSSAACARLPQPGPGSMASSRLACAHMRTSSIRPQPGLRPSPQAQKGCSPEAGPRASCHSALLPGWSH